MNWKKELLSAVLVLGIAFVLGVLNDLIFYHDPLANVWENLKWGVCLDIVLFIFNMIYYLAAKHAQNRNKKRRR